jgi:hypothetical protein
MPMSNLQQTGQRAKVDQGQEALLHTILHTLRLANRFYNLKQSVKGQESLCKGLILQDTSTVVSGKILDLTSI